MKGKKWQPRTTISLSPIVAMEPFSGETPPRNVFGRQCIYVPRESGARAWDLILHVPSSRALVFLQVSKMTLCSHDHKDDKYRIRSSLSGDRDSLVARLINGITGFQCSTHESPSGEIDVKGLGDLEVYFIYVTSQTEDSIAKAESHIDTETTPKYSNLLIMTKADRNSSPLGCLDVRWVPAR